METMSYKRLNLNRALIKDAITVEGTTVSGPEEKGNETLFTVFENGIRVALLAVYFNQDGSTSISAKGNTAEVEKGGELAKRVKDTCLFSDRASVELSLKMSEQDFNDALEYLIEECSAEETEVKDINGGKQYKLTGASGDTLMVKYYTRRKAMQVQGKPLALYDDLITMLCELLPYEEVVQSQLKQIKVQVAPGVVRDILEGRLPNAYGFLSEKVRSIISPALALSQVDIELDDYTSFAMPVLRGLEGYLKLLFSSKNQTVGKTFGNLIVGGDGKCSVLPNIQTTLNCNKTVAAIEECYDYWADNRHGLFHVDSVTESTRILDRQEADQIITKTLKLIDETYSKIVS